MKMKLTYVFAVYESSQCMTKTQNLEDWEDFSLKWQVAAVKLDAECISVSVLKSDAFDEIE